MAESCFIFECYSEGRMLFRACSESSGLPDPLPETPVARAVQAAAIKKGCRLTYFYIATGLTKAEAAILLRRMAAAEAELTANSRPSVEVEWLPGSGHFRLQTERRSAFSQAKSEAVPLES
jgi:hypothetical protein